MGDIKDKYTTEYLQELADQELIYPEGSSHYRKLLSETISNNNWNVDLEDGNSENNIVHEEIWWDACKIINELAQLVLDEREKRKKYLTELRRTLTDVLDEISDKNFEDYY